MDLDELGLSSRDIERSVWLITPTRHFAGAAAIAAIFRAQPQFFWRFVGHLMDTWPVSVIAELGYKLVSASRRYLPAPKTPTCDAPHR